MKSILSYIIAALALVAFPAAAQTQLPPPELDLTWQDNSDNETGFEIERAPVSADGTIGAFQLLDTVPADVAAFTDSEIEYGRTYAYRVKAFNAFGWSGYTNVSLGQAKDPRAAAATMLLVVFAAPDGHSYTVDFRADGTPYLVRLPSK